MRMTSINFFIYIENVFYDSCLFLYGYNNILNQYKKGGFYKKIYTNIEGG